MDERTYTERELRERVDERREYIRQSMIGRIRDDGLSTIDVRLTYEAAPGGVLVKVDPDHFRQEMIRIVEGSTANLLNAVLDALFDD